MPEILEAGVHLVFPRGHHLHCLVAQLPVRVRWADRSYELAEPARQWADVQSVLQRVATGERLRNCHFIVFPESCVPASRFDDMLQAVGGTLQPSSVAIFGVEHVALHTYRELLERHRNDNEAALALVDKDLRGGAPPHLPVNWCCVAVRESTGRLRVFLEAKTHPYRGEESLYKEDDLYRGRHLYLFRNEPSCFNFMTLICFDYIYRDLYRSNIRQIIDHANELFFSSRQAIDALFVIQANPKPEHRAFWEVLTGFYGEYLEQTPGVRDTVTVLANCSDESVIDGEGGGSFGASAVVVGRQHKLVHVDDGEFRTDDFDGAPLCRLRFGTPTRLYYFNLPAYHPLDPRTSRIPIKVHLIMERAADGWREELKVPWPNAPWSPSLRRA